MSQVVERLAALGVTLPKPAAPVANYVGAQKGGALLFVSGQLPGGADGILGQALGRVMEAAMGDRPRGEPGRRAHGAISNSASTSAIEPSGK